MSAPVIADGGTGDQNQMLDSVFQLCCLPLLTDSHPDIHASSNVVDYRVDVDAGFCDRNAFVAAMAKYLEEAAEQAKMVLTVNQSNIRKIYLTTCFLLEKSFDRAHYGYPVVYVKS